MQILEYITQNYTLFLVGSIIILFAIIGYYADKTNFGQGKTEDKPEDSDIELQRDLKNVRLLDVAGGNNLSDNQTFTNEQNNLINNQVSNVSQNLPTNNQETNINQNGPVIVPINFVPTNEFVSKNAVGAIQNQNEILIDNSNLQIPVSSQSGLNQINNLSSHETVFQNQNELMIDEKRFSNEIIRDVINKQVNLVNNNLSSNTAQASKIDQKEKEFDKFSEEFDSLLPKQELINSDLLNEIDDLELGKTQKIDLSDLSMLDNIELPRINSAVKKEKDIWKF